ncbi:MAG: chromosomal replication initiator protein DnaA, partial [Proteobacteria bacterium]|nr:chromosomal replication initiator protein DnaA [Pseudomonadota bacterium]
IQIRPRRTPSHFGSPKRLHTLTSASHNQQGQPSTGESNEFSMDERYTFSSFIKGPSNQFSYAICQNVVQSPGTTYNPLFIYGYSGLGKTHLLHAVGNALKQKYPDHPVILTTTDSFMSELIYCIRHNKQLKFKEKYQQCSALLVDDIQFISGKKATQEEFFHIFNFLYERKKQIIMTSDKYPHEIPDIEERLRNRFEWGLISDIQPPDQEHLMAILYAKAEEYQVQLHKDVAEYMTERWSKNIRELEGALHRLVAHAEFHQQPIDLKLIDEMTSKKDGGPSKPTILKVQTLIAEHYGITLDDLKSSKRQRKFVRPRQVAFYLARQFTGASFPEIGLAFGGRDHSTVMHGVNKVSGELVSSVALKKELVSIQRHLRRY